MPWLVCADFLLVSELVRAKLGLKSQPQPVTSLEVYSVASESIRPSQVVENDKTLGLAIGRRCQPGPFKAVLAASRVFLFPERPELQAGLWHQVPAWLLAPMRGLAPLTCRPCVPCKPLVKSAAKGPPHRPSKGFSLAVRLPPSTWSKICAMPRLRVPQSRCRVVTSASGFKSRKPLPFFSRTFHQLEHPELLPRPSLSGMFLMAGLGLSRRTARKLSQVHHPVPLRAMSRRPFRVNPACAQGLRRTRGLSAGWVLFRAQGAKTSTRCGLPRFTSRSRLGHPSAALSRRRRVSRRLAPMPLVCRRLVHVATPNWGSFRWGAGRLPYACDPLPFCCETNVLSAGSLLQSMAAHNHLDPPPESPSVQTRFRLGLAWILKPSGPKSGSSLAVAYVCRPMGYEHQCPRHMSRGHPLRTTSRRGLGWPLVCPHARQLSLQRCALNVFARRAKTFAPCTLELHAASCKMLPRLFRRGLDQRWLQLVVVFSAFFLRPRCHLAPHIWISVGSGPSRLLLSLAGLRGLDRQSSLQHLHIHARGQPSLRHLKTNSHELAVLVERFIRNFSMWPASLKGLQLRDLPAMWLSWSVCGMQPRLVMPSLLCESGRLGVGTMPLKGRKLSVPVPPLHRRPRSLIAPPPGPLRLPGSVVHTADLETRLRMDGGILRPDPTNWSQGCNYLVLLGLPLSLEWVVRDSDVQLSCRRARVRKLLKR